jgi:hypothetical protein
MMAGHHRLANPGFQTSLSEVQRPENPGFACSGNPGFQTSLSEVQRPENDQTLESP